MATLSPFRYLQVARYILQRFIDRPSISSSSRKGKNRSLEPVVQPARAVLQPSLALATAQGGAHASSVEAQSLDAQPVAGPSKRRDELFPDPTLPPEPHEIYKYMNDERLVTPGAAKPPREIVVLCHGLYGFSTATPIPLFPSLKLHYWASVLEVLRDRMGVKVLVVGVKGTGSIQERAEQMHAFLKEKLPKGVGVNFVAHSMGGLDVRHLISNIKPTTYTPLSLTTIGTPHRGSPFMDWCTANIGVGTATAVAAAALGAEVTKHLPFSLKSPLLARAAGEKAAKDEGTFGGFTSALTSYLLNIFDSPAYANLTTAYLRDHFNPATPDSPAVKYTSVAGRIAEMSVLHPLWFPKLVLDAAGERGYPAEYEHLGAYEGNDGLVSVSSAKWGEFMGTVDGCHHWDLRGEGGLWPQGGTTSTKPEGKPDESLPGGWDWQGGLSSQLGEQLELAPTTTTAAAAAAAGAVSPPLSDQRKRDLGKEASESSSSSWDIAQVGQVIDWITDLVPGGKSTETGKKQLADAQKEKDDATKASRVNGTANGNGKDKKPKFDLARFYGGLMLKLRDDGY